MPSWRAMIAVWLVGPPLLGHQGAHDRGVEPGGVGRREVLGDQHRRLGRRGTPGSGSPTRWATMRRSMSRRSVTRSAIRPPMLVNTADELLDGGRAPRSSRSAPAGERLAHGAAQALVARQAGAGGRAPRRRRRWPARALRAKPSATASAASSYAARAASASAKPPSPKRAIGRRARPRRAPRGRGRARQPGTDRGAAESDARVQSWHGITTTAPSLDSQHIRA